MSLNNHEEVVFCNDANTGLKAIIAIHNTQLGPSLGGCRFYPYANESDALTDVLRLSRGMTYKAAVAGINLGGGKSVIIGDPKTIASEALFRVFGRFIQGLNGRYITAEDIGTTTKFMEWINYETRHVTGCPSCYGGSGDPSPFTAHGTFVGIKAALKKMRGNDNVTGIKVAVEGLGNVGYNLCKELHEANAKLFVYDINPEAVKRVVDNFAAIAVHPNELHSAAVDVYAPCALGATLNDKTIAQLKCSIVAGAANNQLHEEEKHGSALKHRGILYTPDYVINAGGLINVASEVFGGGPETVWQKVEDIYDTLLTIFNIAELENITTAEAAKRVAEKRMREVSLTKNIYLEE